MSNLTSDLTTITTQQLITELAVSRDTYYADLKFLGIQPSKTEQGKSYLDETQANLVRELRTYMSQNRKREGFSGHLPTAIPVAAPGTIVPTPPTKIQNLPSANGQLAEVDFVEPQAQEVGEDQVIEAASVLAAHGMTLNEQVVLQVAGQMEYQDLLPGHQAKVDELREACRPKGQAAAIATDLLTKHRQRNPAA